MTNNQKQLLILKISLKQKLLKNDESILESVDTLNMEELTIDEKSSIEESVIGLCQEKLTKENIALLNKFIAKFDFLNKEKFEFLIENQTLDYSDKDKMTKFLNKYMDKKIEFKNSFEEYNFYNILVKIAILIDNSKMTQQLIEKIQQVE